MLSLIADSLKFLLKSVGITFVILLAVWCPVISQNDSTQLKRFPTFEDFSPLLQQPKSGITILNFWATWCKPCVEELPYFEALTEKYRNNPTIRVILVSLDFPNQIESRLIPFIEKHQLKSQVVALLDVRANDWINLVDANWSGAIPATLILSPGQRKFLEKNYSSLTELEADLPLFSKY